MDPQQTIQDLGETYNSLPEPFKREMTKTGSAIIVNMAQNGGKMFKSFLDSLFKKGLTETEIDKKSMEDPAYLSQVSRAVMNLSYQQVEEKIEAWANLVFKIHTGQLQDHLDIDFCSKALEDCTVQDLLVLGQVYQGNFDEIKDRPIGTDDLVMVLKPEKFKMSLQRLASFGLIDTKFDRAGYYSDGKSPILADTIFMRNSLGKDFLVYIGHLREAHRAPIVA